MTDVVAAEADGTALALDPRWLAAVLPATLAFVGPTSEVQIPLEGPGVDPAQLLETLTPLLDRAGLADVLGATAVEVEELIGALSEAGALSAPPAVDDTTTLGLMAALLAARSSEPLTADGPVTVVTADELLVLPAAMGRSRERAALRAFVGGLAPDLRLRAYCRVATEGVPAVRGDHPTSDALSRALAVASALDEGLVAVIGMATGASATVAPDDLDRIGCERPHRLGPLLTVGPLERAGSSRSNGAMHVHVARYAVANLRFPQPADTRMGGGRADDPELAALIARAEAAERYGSGDLAGRELRRANESDLDAPFVAPADVFRVNERQRRDDLIPYDPAAGYLWVPGVNPVGERRWVPADAVFYPYFDPVRGGRLLPTNSSGSAAHTSLAEARLRALCELIERDAFMWTWVQRVERELIDERSLPADQRERAAGMRARGLTVAFVNLTLDMLPVLGCVIHSPETLSLALACSPDPAAAAGRALKEAIGLVDVIDRGRLARVTPEEVRMPDQHAALHLDPARIEEDRFLYGSSDRVGVEEIAVLDASPDELVATVGEPVTVDLSSPATAPFHVARVVVPRLVPISFGYDREPLGMARLAEPKRTHDGRELGTELDLSRVGPLDPHPFA